MKARLLYYEKVQLYERYLLEMEMYEIGKSTDYPYGIKYGFILIDWVTGRRVLMDNHYPKGPHVHLDEKEFTYVFIDKETLFKDFRALVLEHLEVPL